jgi:hypothetical protein
MRVAAAAGRRADVDQSRHPRRQQQFGDALGTGCSVPERDQWHRHEHSPAHAAVHWDALNSLFVQFAANLSQDESFPQALRQELPVSPAGRPLRTS